DKLHHLYLQNNLLGLMDTVKLSQILNNLTHVVELYLSGNKLSRLPNLTNMKNLLRLNLASNQIETLEGNEQSFLSNERLTELNLNDNRICTLTSTTFAHLTK